MSLEQRGEIEAHGDGLKKNPGMVLCIYNHLSYMCAVEIAQRTIPGYPLNEDKGTVLLSCVSIVISAILAVIAMPANIAYAFIIQLLGVETATYLPQTMTQSVTGTITYHAIRVIDPASPRMTHYDGTHVVAQATDTQTGKRVTTHYDEGITPQLIDAGDSTIAYWVFSDFWTDYYPGVKSWVT